MDSFDETLEWASKQRPVLRSDEISISINTFILVIIGLFVVFVGLIFLSSYFNGPNEESKEVESGEAQN
jgi:cytochrome bd-type quinol oxidase subunit 1